MALTANNLSANDAQQIAFISANPEIPENSSTHEIRKQKEGRFSNRN